MRMLLLKTWRDLLARKGQFAALILLVTLGVMSFVSFLTSYIDLNASVERANDELKFADFYVTVLGAPQGEIAAIARIPGSARSKDGSSSTWGSTSGPICSRWPESSACRWTTGLVSTTCSSSRGATSRRAGMTKRWSTASTRRTRAPRWATRSSCGWAASASA